MIKILFPTDFSATANNAFIYALHLANKLEAKIIVLNIATHMDDVGEDFFELDEVRKKGLSDLNKLAIQHQLEHVSFQFLYEKGELLYSILELIKREAINYVVMGTNGENAIDKKFFGSNTINVINNSTIPVLVVPHQVLFKIERKFAYATLFEEYEETAIQEMQRIVKRYQTHLEILHVVEDDPSFDWRMKRREWEALHKNLDVILVKNNQPETALINYCTTNKIDVLGIVHREMNYFVRIFKTNFSKYLINHANFALLIFPSRK